MFFAILTSIMSGIALTGIMFLVHKFNKLVKDFNTEFRELKISQRNQIKAQIVSVYETAKIRGHITHMELETTNRLADSYFKLDGNNYIHALMGKINKQIPVAGEAIPIDSGLEHHEN